MSSLYGVSAYQQTNEVWNSKTNNTKNDKTSNTKESDAKGTDKVKTTDFKPIDTKSSLVPTVKNGYGTVIGNVELSDKAKDYYDKLKAKFHNMDFILVSKDMKSQVAANAAAYGNASKQVVLIDDEKLEKMATDESFRKKYEGIIAMSQLKLQEAKNSLASRGASVKNFGMSVGSDGKTSFFATLEISNNNAKALEKKQAEKKAAKSKEKKQAEKKAKEEQLEKIREEKKTSEKEAEEASNETMDDREYVEIKADSMDELISKVSRYAYDYSANNVLTESEKQVGQSVDYSV